MSHKKTMTTSAQSPRETRTVQGRAVISGVPQGDLAFDIEGAPDISCAQALAAAVFTLSEPEFGVIVELHRVDDALSDDELASELRCSTEFVEALHVRAVRMVQHAMDAAAALPA